MLFLKFLVEEILRCFAEVGQISVYICYVPFLIRVLIRDGNTVTFTIWKDSSYVCQELDYIFNQYFPIACLMQISLVMQVTKCEIQKIPEVILCESTV